MKELLRGRDNLVVIFVLKQESIFFPVVHKNGVNYAGFQCCDSLWPKLVGDG